MSHSVTDEGQTLNLSVFYVSIAARSPPFICIYYLTALSETPILPLERFSMYFENKTKNLVLTQLFIGCIN